MATHNHISARRLDCNPRNRNLVSLILVSCLMFGFTSRAAGPALDWVKLVGSPPGDRGMYCYAVATDSLDNIYVGSGPNLALTKFDPAGNRIWSFGIGSNDHTGAIFVNAIEVDSSNHLYVVGNIYGNLNLGALTYNRNDPAVFIAKMTPAGSILYAKFFYNMFVDYKPLTRATNGTLFVGGRFSNPVTYEGITLSSLGYLDAALFKLNADGSPVWGRRGAGTQDEYLYGVACSDSGDVFAAGGSTSNPFGMGGMSLGVGGYLLSLDAQGNGRWATNGAAAGSLPNSASSVAYSRSSGAIFWAGGFAGSFGLVSPPLTSSGSVDAFVARLSSSGNVAWARKLGGSQDQFANAVAVDDSGANVYVAGFFFGQITIAGETFTSRGLQDIFVAKFADNGTPLWGKHIGWIGRDTDAALGFTRAGNLLVVGSAGAGVSVDGVFLEGTGLSEGFLAKFRLEGSLPIFSAHPRSQAVSAGMTVSLTAQATSDLPMTFQWWFNGSPLAGKTNATLTISNVQPAQAGSYYLVASNGVGHAQSNPALLSYTDASTLVLGVHPSLTIFGTTGRTYRIEFATETQGAAQWTAATNLTLTTTPEIWLDRDAAVGQSRFYRVILQP